MVRARIVLASLFVLAACGSEPEFVGAPGVVIDEIAMYQGVKRSLVGGEAGQDIPIVAGRDALIRVFATGTEEYNRGPVLARLTLATPDGDTQVFEQAIQSLPVVSDEPALDSTLNIWVPGDAIKTDTNYRLELLQEADQVSGDNPNAAYPVEKNQVIPLGAQPATRPLEIVLVPVVNNGLSPDVSDAQLERYRVGFMDQYPATEISLSVRDSIEFNQPITGDGAGWSTLLNSLAELRSQDGVESHVYYYGIFTPASQFGAYCTGGCILGLGFVPRESDAFMRVAIGLGYTGEGSVDTSVHEVGHNHGRQHAPCGTQDSDRQFPHQSGLIGTWGFQMSTRELKSPFEYTDFMGYCRDTWVSDYTYKALYERMRAVDGQRLDTSPRTYNRVAFGPDGVETLSPVTIRTHVSLNRAFVGTTKGGVEVEGEGHFVPYDHLDGGVMLIPNQFADLQVTALGEEIRLSR